MKPKKTGCLKVSDTQYFSEKARTYDRKVHKDKTHSTAKNI
tara:strand:- start:1061 stop:1183 length:123 start_codon:yes stop_codon:yes gene_type:complete